MRRAASEHNVAVQVGPDVGVATDDITRREFVDAALRAAEQRWLEQRLRAREPRVLDAYRPAARGAKYGSVW